MMPEWPLEPQDSARFPCPVCGERHPVWMVRDRLRRVLGCNECLQVVEPEEVWAE